MAAQSLGQYADDIIQNQKDLALFEAVRSDSLEQVVGMLEIGANPNYVLTLEEKRRIDPNGWYQYKNNSPISQVLFASHNPRVLNALLDRGAIPLIDEAIDGLCSIIRMAGIETLKRIFTDPRFGDFVKAATRGLNKITFLAPSSTFASLGAYQHWR